MSCQPELGHTNNAFHSKFSLFLPIIICPSPQFTGYGLTSTVLSLFFSSSHTGKGQSRLLLALLEGGQAATFKTCGEGEENMLVCYLVQQDTVSRVT
jgi:hypothetical protein